MYNFTVTSLMLTGIKSAAVFSIVYLMVSAAQMWSKQRRLFHYGNKFPGPKTVPIFGNGLQLNGTHSDLFSKFVDLMYVYKSRFRLWLGWELLIFVNEPEDAQIILNKALAKPPLYKLFIAQKGSLLAPIPLWRKHRKLLIPAFHTKVLETFMEVFITQSEILCKKLKSKVGEPEFDITDFVIHCTLDSIFETSLGIKLETEEDKKIYEFWDRMIQITSKRIFNILLRPECIFLRTKYGIEYTKYTDIVYDLTERVIREKKTQAIKKARQNRSATNGISDDDEEDGLRIRKRLPIIELLMDAQRQEGSKEKLMTDEEMRDEIVVIMMAGTDTTAMALCSTLVLLGMNQEIQDKAYSELYDIFGDSDRRPDLDDLKDMPYLERVLKESMRLFPVAILLPRGADEDIVLSDKSVIPRGATCVACVWKLHRDPEVWPDPTRFDPDRFLPEEVAKRHPYSYIPFSAGPRNCMGMKYAWMSMVVMLSTVLRHYKVSCDYKMEDMKMEFHLLTKSENGFRVRLERRIQK